MKRLLILIALCIVISLAADNWNLFVYMAADNNLSQNGKQQINEMEAVAQAAELNIILQADFPEGAKRYQIKQDYSPSMITSPVLQDLGYIDSGYWKTLNDFLIWGRKKYPAQRNMLVIWGHGNSWFKEGEKWVATDNSSGNAIGVANKDLQKALSDTGHWDILLFDACSMQSLEVLSEVKDYCSYLIGSEDLLPARGFPYGSIIPILDQSPAQIAAQIPPLFRESYLPGGIYNPYTGYLPTTCSSIAMADFPAFLNHWKVFCRSLRSNLDSLLGLRKKLFEMNDGMADIDMQQFLMACTDAGFAGANEMLNHWNSLVVASTFTSQEDLQDIGTAALWFPTLRSAYDTMYFKYLWLDFCTTGWLGTLKRVFEDERLPIQPMPTNIRVWGDKIMLDLQIGRHADSLYCRVDIGDNEYYFYPEAYKTSFSIVLPLPSLYSYVYFRSFDEAGNSPHSYAILPYDYRPQPLNLRVFPNPSRHGIPTKALWHSGEHPQCAVEVYNLKGQLIFREKAPQALPSGILELHSLDGFRALDKGKYLLRIDLGKKSLQAKFSIL